jgi:hypothetical protein
VVASSTATSIFGYLGLLILGKNDFEAVEGFCSQCFAHQALGLRAVPSSVTLRHRCDAMGTQWSEQAGPINCALLGLRINGVPKEFGVLPTSHLPLDIAPSSWTGATRSRRVCSGFALG